MINNTWSSESSSRYSGGQMSGLVDKPWPNFTKVGPNRVKILLSSAARFLLFWSSTPFRWSINSFRENEPKATNICRVLRNNWINIIINQLIRNKKKSFFFLRKGEKVLLMLRQPEQAVNRNCGQEARGCIRRHLQHVPWLLPPLEGRPLCPQPKLFVRNRNRSFSLALVLLLASLPPEPLWQLL